MAAAAGSASPAVVDAANESRDLWLVKIPKPLALAWSKAAPGQALATLRAAEDGTHALTLSAGAGTGKLPQSYAVQFAPHPPLFRAFSTNEANEVALQGTVQRNATLRPEAGRRYSQLLRKRLVKSINPERSVQALDDAPRVGDASSREHFAARIQQHRVEHGLDQPRGAAGRRAAGAVPVSAADARSLIFKAFEEAQFVSLKQLQAATQQSDAYVKEILKEFCTYHPSGEHRGCYELKSAYRGAGAGSEGGAGAGAEAEEGGAKKRARTS